MGPVDIHVSDGLAFISVDHPPVNALSLTVRQGLARAIAAANADPLVDGLILRTIGKTFIAGADIKELQQGMHLQSPTVRDIQDMIEAGKPSVAAIHGSALGGGLELALTCTFRVGLPDATVGLPEVKLGLLPGAGGTQRLTRLCGPRVALDVILSGRRLDAKEASDLGIFDAIVTDTHDAPARFLRDRLAAGDVPPPILERSHAIANVDAAIFTDARTNNRKRARGRLAPDAVVDCIEAACRLPGAEGVAFERAQFDALQGGEQNRALAYAFFAERDAAKALGSNPAPALEVARAGIVGGGLMGSGIAVALANAGIDVILVDVDQDATSAAQQRIAQIHAGAVARGAMSDAARHAAQNHIHFHTDYRSFSSCDLVIEAAPERMAIKESIFARLGEVTPAHAILASNTSSLDIDRMAAASNHPSRVIGLHFFSPAHVMKLVEVVRSGASSPEALSTGMALARRLGKVAVLAGNCDGFIANRSLQFYTGQAEFLMEQGASPEQIDHVAEAFGMPMGPVAMRDMAGLDVAALVRSVRARTLPPEERLSPLIEKMVEAGRLGQKSGAGFYRYEGRKRITDPEALAIIQAAARELGIRQRSFTDEEIRDRLFLPIINEGAREIEEDIALRASDIDVAWVNGYGFPAHRGGPMYWGEQTGLDRVVAMAERLGAELGPRWQPSALLRHVAASGGEWSRTLGGKD